MRAIQRAIVGVGLALVAVVAMALLIGDLRWAGPDPASQPSQATGPRGPLVDAPAGPPEPVDAAEDTSVGTLPPPADASPSTELVSRDLLAPSDSTQSSPGARTPNDGKALNARKARPAEKSTGSSASAVPEHDFTANQDGDDGDDCRRHDRYDHYAARDHCDRRDRDRNRDRRD